MKPVTTVNTPTHLPIPTPPRHNHFECILRYCKSNALNDSLLFFAWNYARYDQELSIIHDDIKWSASTNAFSYYVTLL